MIANEAERWGYKCSKKDFFVQTSKDKIVVNHYNIYKYNRPTAAFCLNTKDSKWKAIIITYLLHISIDKIQCIQTHIHNNIQEDKIILIFKVCYSKCTVSYLYIL